PSLNVLINLCIHINVCTPLKAICPNYWLTRMSTLLDFGSGSNCERSGFEIIENGGVPSSLLRHSRICPIEGQFC
ncbi:MAG: hypothetical protein OXC62_06925, partial [Aestuariivita sp.]|nr:hypothetical protein [Aestuariivita sp.]